MLNKNKYVIIIAYLFLCRCAGIGRRGRLKICCQQWRVGSSPTTGTNEEDKNSLLFLVEEIEMSGLEKEGAQFCDNRVDTKLEQK